MQVFESTGKNHPKMELISDPSEVVSKMGDYFPVLKTSGAAEHYRSKYGDFHMITNPNSKEVYGFHVYDDPQNPKSMTFTQEGKSINLESIYPQTLKDGDLENMFVDACDEYGAKMYKAVLWAKKNIHSLSPNFYNKCLDIIKKKVSEDLTTLVDLSEYPEIQDECKGEFGEKFPDLFNMFKRGY